MTAKFVLICLCFAIIWWAVYQTVIYYEAVQIVRRNLRKDEYVDSRAIYQLLRDHKLRISRTQFYTVMAHLEEKKIIQLAVKETALVQPNGEETTLRVRCYRLGDKA